jgi:hypothetical protein
VSLVWARGWARGLVCSDARRVYAACDRPAPVPWQAPVGSICVRLRTPRRAWGRYREAARVQSTGGEEETGCTTTPTTLAHAVRSSLSLPDPETEDGDVRQGRDTAPGLARSSPCVRSASMPGPSQPASAYAVELEALLSSLQPREGGWQRSGSSGRSNRLPSALYTSHLRTATCSAKVLVCAPWGATGVSWICVRCAL